MAKDLIYTAIIEKDDDAFGVTFPDLPGCVSVGDTFEEAVSSAAEALSAHLAFATDTHMRIPHPTAFEKINEKADRTIRVVAKIPVSAKVPGQFERINITMDANLLDLSDSTAEAYGMTRSAFLALGARNLVDSLAAKVRPGKTNKPRKKTRRVASGKSKLRKKA